MLEKLFYQKSGSASLFCFVDKWYNETPPRISINEKRKGADYEKTFTCAITYGGSCRNGA